MKKTYIILGSIAAVVLAVYLLLPDVLFEELVFPMDKGTTVLAYDDRADGGESTTTFKVTDSELSFECSLGADTSKFSWCGLLWNFDPDSLKEFRNWIFVDSLIFDLDVSGTREVLVKLWAYDPDVTDIRKPKTFRLLMKEMPLHDGHNRVSIPMEQLYTPEFWSEDIKTEVNLKQRHHETMARLEIAPGWNQARGTSFSLKIHSIKAVGVSNFNYGIVLAIFVVLTIIAVGWRHKVKSDEE
jgi:hypothetical protein